MTPKLRENLAAFEERARNNEHVMRLIRDVPLDFSLDDLTLGGWRRAEVNAFFERYEMNSMRTRFNKLMQDGLLGEPAASDEADVGGAARSTRRYRSRRCPSRRWRRSSAAARRRSSPLITNASRCSTAVSGAVAVVDLAEFFAGAKDVVFAGHDLKGLYRLAGEAGVELREAADDTSIMAFLVDAISGHYELRRRGAALSR